MSSPRGYHRSIADWASAQPSSVRPPRGALSSGRVIASPASGLSPRRRHGARPGLRVADVRADAARHGLGFVVGLLPGLGGPTTLALMLPFVFKMRTVAICGWILGMYAAIWLLGFSLATLVTTVLYLRVARERWPLGIGLSLAVFPFVYGLFEKALSVPFPPSQLFVWLGYGG